MRSRPVLTVALPALTLGAMTWGMLPARADVVTPPGNCVGTAAFSNGADGAFTVDSSALTSSDVTTIPLSDDVTWQASLNGVTAGSQRDIAGFVKLDMPWPIPDVTLDRWSGPSSLTENSGTKHYSLPSFTPRDVVLDVYGEHRESGTLFCSGSAKVKIAGSAFSSIVTPVSLAMLAGSLGLSLLASRKGRAGLGAVAGLATMISLGLALLMFGALPLNSSLLTVLPLAGLVLGGLWGKLGLLA